MYKKNTKRRRRKSTEEKHLENTYNVITFIGSVWETYESFAIRIFCSSSFYFLTLKTSAKIYSLYKYIKGGRHIIVLRKKPKKDRI